MAKKQEQQKKIAGVLFAVYGLLMLYLLFVRNRTAVDGLPYWEQVRQNYNLIPFHTIDDYWHILTNKEYYLDKWGAYAIYRDQARHAFINLVGNVVMLMPLGYFLPTVSGKYRTLFRTLFAGAGMIIAVEILQLFTLRGSCDVDDLILNLCGVILGYFCWGPRRKK